MRFRPSIVVTVVFFVLMGCRSFNLQTCFRTVLELILTILPMVSLDGEMANILTTVSVFSNSDSSS